jgi:nucleotide-binding universal stress UspA family protein
MNQQLFAKIVVALDGSPASEKALVAAVDLAAHYQAELIAVSVAEVAPAGVMIREVEEVRQQTEDHLRQIGAAAVEYARGRGMLLRSVVVRGHPAESIVRFAETEGTNLVVLGQHGHSRITRFFLGSTTDRVSEHCPCTVMIVK